MNRILIFLMYFSVGFTQDALVCRYTKCTCSGAALPAAVLSVVISILSVFVLDKILIEKDLVITMVYFSGLFAGTYCATRLNK